MKKAPNILLILADQHRFDWFEDEQVDLPVRTPNLNRLREEGVTFSHVTTPAPLCAPARACLATGRDYDRGPVPSNAFDLPLDFPTYFRALRDEAGYHVAGVGKFDLHKATLDWNPDGSRCLPEWGFSDGIDNEGKFDSLWSGRKGDMGPYLTHLRSEGLADIHLADFERRLHGVYTDTALSPLPEESYLDNWIAGNANLMLDRRPAGVPWHLMINFAGPHDPMDVTESMSERWEDVTFPEPHNPAVAEVDHQTTRQRYAAMIENLDRHVGLLLDRLEREGELDNTIIIYTSDHGEMLGDHGIWGKSVALEASIRIPLIVRGPGVARGGVTLDALVSLEDIAATILELAGLEVLPGMTARSLGAVLRGESSEHRSTVVSGLDRGPVEVANMLRHYGESPWLALASWRTVSTATHKLTVSPQLQAPVLVDLIVDPWEATDIAADRPDLVDELLTRLRDDIGEYPKGAESP